MDPSPLREKGRGSSLPGMQLGKDFKIEASSSKVKDRRKTIHHSWGPGPDRWILGWFREFMIDGFPLHYLMSMVHAWR
jgi:hypothetical protein